MLGTFLLGVLTKKVKEESALVAIWSTILMMIWIIGVRGIILLAITVVGLLAGMWIFVRLQNRFHRNMQVILATLILLIIFGVKPLVIAWPWYVFIGTVVTFGIGIALEKLAQVFATTDQSRS